MKVITAPNEYENVDGQIKIFLAGGISGCPDWQKEFIEKTQDLEDNIVLFNPRRESFDVNDKNVSKEQITWEYNHLRKSDIVVFWFPKETLCPIALYELGALSLQNIPLVVGCEYGYQRDFDVLEQLKLARGEFHIDRRIDSVITELKNVIKKSYR